MYYVFGSKEIVGQANSVGDKRENENKALALQGYPS